MTATLRHLRPFTIFTGVVAVAVVAAGWYLYGSVLDDTLIDGQVTGARLVWRPGMNSGGAEDRSSTNPAEASRLAQLVNGTRKRPDRPVNCPADFGSQVHLTFHGAGRQDQRVTIALTGCAGPPGRMMSDALRNDLERLAPAGFWPQRLQ